MAEQIFIFYVSESFQSFNWVLVSSHLSLNKVSKFTSSKPKQEMQGTKNVQDSILELQLIIILISI